MKSLDDLLFFTETQIPNKIMTQDKNEHEIRGQMHEVGRHVETNIAARFRAR